MKLTKKMTLFCEEYVKSRNATESALKAGYSPSFAKSKAYTLLEHDDIKEKISDIETTYFYNKFKELSLVAFTILEEVLKDPQNRNTQLKAIKLILQAGGVIDRFGDSNSQEDSILKVIIPEEYYSMDFMQNTLP